jgi:hypothetical protein
LSIVQGTTNQKYRLQHQFTALKKDFARQMNFTYHNLQHKTVRQFKHISEGKCLDAILEANTQINQNYEGRATITRVNKTSR